MDMFYVVFTFSLQMVKIQTSFITMERPNHRQEENVSIEAVPLGRMEGKIHMITKRVKKSLAL